MTPKAGILAGVASVVLLSGAFVYQFGAVRVEVQAKSRDGEHIRLVVPAVVVPIGLRLAPRQKLQEAAQKIEPWFPAIQAATEELGRCPDAVFVQVDGPAEHVRIAKKGDLVTIDVDDPNETVHVSFPVGMVYDAARQLAAQAPTT